MTVRNLYIEYDKQNERGTFSPGDTLSGRVFVVTNKESKVQCFVVKAKGKAEVRWAEQGGPNPTIQEHKKTYFYFEEILLQDKKGDGSVVIGPGINVFPFAFELPKRDMPSSYQGTWGKIVYSLRAKLTRSIWHVHKTKMEVPFLSRSEFPFVSKSDSILIGLKEPQSATRIAFLGSGKVTLTVTSEKMGVKQGEALLVSMEVNNESVQAMTPNFYLCEKQTFVAQAGRRTQARDVLFATGDVVSALSSQMSRRVLRIPQQLPLTFFNCSLMKLEYQLKVTLEVQRATNPEVKLPLVVLQGHPNPPRRKHGRTRIWFRTF